MLEMASVMIRGAHQPALTEDDPVLLVGLSDDWYLENCAYSPYPHKHILFMSEDGRADVWAPIESKSFLDHVLQWFGNDMSKGAYMYGATIEDIRAALESQRAELLDELTPREQELINDPAQWNRPIISCWYFGFD